MLLPRNQQPLHHLAPQNQQPQRFGVGMSQLGFLARQRLLGRAGWVLVRNGGDTIRAFFLGRAGRIDDESKGSIYLLSRRECLRIYV